MLRSTKRTLVNSINQFRSASSTAPPVRRPYTPRPRPSSSTSTTSTPPTPPTPTPVATVPSPSINQSIGSSTVATPPPQTTTPTSTSLPSSSLSSELPSNDTYASYTPTPIQGQPEIDWSTSYHGLSSIPFTSSQADTLMRPLQAHEIEIKPGALPIFTISR